MAAVNTTTTTTTATNTSIGNTMSRRRHQLDFRMKLLYHAVNPPIKPLSFVKEALALAIEVHDNTALTKLLTHDCIDDIDTLVISDNKTSFQLLLQYRHDTVTADMAAVVTTLLEAGCEPFGGDTVISPVVLMLEDNINWSLLTLMLSVVPSMLSPSEATACRQHRYSIMLFYGTSDYYNTDMTTLEPLLRWGHKNGLSIDVDKCVKLAQESHWTVSGQTRPKVNVARFNQLLHYGCREDNTVGVDILTRLLTANGQDIIDVDTWHLIDNLIKNNLIQRGLHVDVLEDMYEWDIHTFGRLFGIFILYGWDNGTIGLEGEFDDDLTACWDAVRQLPPVKWTVPSLLSCAAVAVSRLEPDWTKWRGYLPHELVELVAQTLPVPALELSAHYRDQVDAALCQVQTIVERVHAQRESKRRLEERTRVIMSGPLETDSDSDYWNDDIEETDYVMTPVADQEYYRNIADILSTKANARGGNCMRRGTGG